MRPSITKFNARYRGPTDTETYVNVFNEILHDIRMLYYALTESASKQGQKHQIVNDLLAVVDGNKPFSGSPAATPITMKKMNEDVEAVEKSMEVIIKELIEWNL
jgi:hypothetical protein